MPGLSDLIHSILEGSQRHDADEEDRRRSKEESHRRREERHRRREERHRRREERHRRREERHRRREECYRRRDEHRRNGQDHRSNSSTSSSSSSDSDNDDRRHYANGPGFPPGPGQPFPAGPPVFPLASVFAPPAFAPPSGPPPVFAAPAGHPPGSATSSGPPPSFATPTGYATRAPQSHAQPLAQRHPIQLSTYDHHAFPPESITGPPPCHDLGGQAVFLGLAHMHGGLHPCKVIPDFGDGAVRVSWNGKEGVHRGAYTLVPFDPARMEWVRAAGGHVPPARRPVEGGHEAGGAPLFHALAHVDGVRVPGKAGAHLSGAYLPFGDRENFAHEYELLCWRY